LTRCCRSCWLNGTPATGAGRRLQRWSPPHRAARNRRHQQLRRRHRQLRRRHQQLRRRLRAVSPTYARVQTDRRQWARVQEAHCVKSTLSTTARLASLGTTSAPLQASEHRPVLLMRARVRMAGPRPSQQGQGQPSLCQGDGTMDCSTCAARFSLVDVGAPAGSAISASTGTDTTCADITPSTLTSLFIGSSNNAQNQINTVLGVTPPDGWNSARNVG
jgi:hypothetical protein